MFESILTNTSQDYITLLTAKTIQPYTVQKLKQKYPKSQREMIHQELSNISVDLQNTKYSDKRLQAKKELKRIQRQTKTTKNEAVKKILKYDQHIIIQLLNLEEGIKDFQALVAFMNEDNKQHRFFIIKHKDFAQDSKLRNLEYKIKTHIQQNVLGIGKYQDFDVKIERIQPGKQLQQYYGFYFRLYLKNFKRQKRTFFQHYVYKNKTQDKKQQKKHKTKNNQKKHQRKNNKNKTQDKKQSKKTLKKKQQQQTQEKKQSKLALIFAANDNYQYTRLTEDDVDQIKQNQTIKITQITPQKTYQYIYFNYHGKNKIFNQDNNLFDWPAHRFIGNLEDGDFYVIWAQHLIKQNELQICKKLGVNHEQSSFIDLGSIYPKKITGQMNNRVLLQTKQPIKPQKNPQLTKQQSKNYQLFHMTKVTNSFQTRDLTESGLINFMDAIKRCQKIWERKIIYSQTENKHQKSIIYNFQNRLYCLQAYVLYALKKKFLFDPTYNFVDEKGIKSQLIKIRIGQKVEEFIKKKTLIQTYDISKI